MPLVHTFIADCETPVSAFLKLRDDGPCFLLESAEEGQRLGRYSMIGVRPQAVVRGVGDQLAVLFADGAIRPSTRTTRSGPSRTSCHPSASPPPPEPLAFYGGAVGFFGYDLVRRVERLPDVPHDDRGIPDIAMMVTGPVVQFDHLRRSLTLVVPCRLDQDEPVEAAYQRALDEMIELKERLAGPVPPRPDRDGKPEIGPIESNMTQAEFEAAVERVREYVFAGDAFQVVPSQRFAAPHVARPVRRVPRVAHGQPVAVHVLPRLRRRRPRRRVTRDAREGERGQGGDPADRGHAPARSDPRRGPAPGGGAAWRIPRSARST